MSRGHGRGVVPAQRCIGVMIHSDDPVVCGGVVGFLRHRPELSLLEADDPLGASVLIMCVDVVDYAALVVLRRNWQAKAMRTVLMVGRIREAELYGALESLGTRAHACLYDFRLALEMTSQENGRCPSPADGQGSPAARSRTRDQAADSRILMCLIVT